MGLESIYLTENMELKYRLSMRAARVLGILFDAQKELSPNFIKSLIGLSYDIRSTFVHGDALEKGLLKKVKDQYSDLQNILILTLNYLRISILLCIILNFNKKDFVSCIDGALINESDLEKLREKVFPLKEILIF
jgi:hypothetical protein